ncbi:MAG: hypothetical protein NZM10_07355 [Fimbriimonadales bacterium]|nr:hypothetical protein [Fimbriimonadales bacterium]MCS7190003.1 hypothetical protein [Fimbriimonadales bacterium]
MKKEVPTWAVVLAIAVVLALIGVWYFSSTSKSTSDTVVEKTFGSESDPFGTQARPQGAQPGTGASGP